MNDGVILIGLDYSLASKEVIEVLLDDDPEPQLVNDIVKANEKRPEILQLVFHHENTPDDAKAVLSGVLQVPVTIRHPVPEHVPREKKSESLMLKIQRLTVAERLQLAMRGGREIRSILVKDSNKQVVMGVLDNQKITEGEIEMLTKNRSISEEVLRRITKNRDWMKSYAIMQGLITNPKTPPGISVSLVSSLKTKDLSVLEKNKNVADLVRTVAKKILSARRPK